MERIRIILEFLKSELESKFEVKNSTFQTSSQCLLGTVGDEFLFEDYEGRSISIEYWDSGTILIGASNIAANIDYLFYDYTPVDYQDKVYPKESEEILVKKINELLEKLHSENKEVIACLPDM